MAELLLGEIYLKASQVPPAGQGMVSMVDLALDSWQGIPDDRLREFVERAIVRAAPYAATIATVAKIWQDRNRDDHGHAVHDQIAAQRHQAAHAAPSNAPRLTDDGGKPISSMPRAEYLRQCAAMYKNAGLQVPDYLQELDLPQTLPTPTAKSG